MTCCWWRLTHPARVTSSSRKGERAVVIGRSYRATFRPLSRARPSIRTLQLLYRRQSGHELRYRARPWAGVLRSAAQGQPDTVEESTLSNSTDLRGHGDGCYPVNTMNSPAG